MNVLISIQQPVKAWQIPDACIATLRVQFPQHTFIHATNEDARERGLETCEVAYTWILSATELDRARHLRWVHTSAVAVETLCLPELVARGVIVSNSRGIQATPIAEHVMAVMLAFAKQLPFVLERQRAHQWSQNELIGDRLPWLLRGRTLGLIGMGTIGSQVAQRANAFGMRVLGARRRLEQGSVLGVETVSDLDALLAASDVVVIAAPLTRETENLLGAAQFAQMKKGAVLINVGRARIVDHVALAHALRSGHLGGASLDVFPQEPLPADHELWSLPNVILTPHTSGFRVGHWDEVIALFAENLARYERGDEVRFRVRPELGY